MVAHLLARPDESVQVIADASTSELRADEGQRSLHSLGLDVALFVARASSSIRYRQRLATQVPSKPSRLASSML